MAKLTASLTSFKTLVLFFIFHIISICPYEAAMTTIGFDGGGEPNCEQFHLQQIHQCEIFLLRQCDNLKSCMVVYGECCQELSVIPEQCACVVLEKLFHKYQYILDPRSRRLQMVKLAEHNQFAHNFI